MMRARFVVAVVAVCVGIGSLAPTVQAATPEEELFEATRLLIDSFDQIDRNYVKEVSRRELVEAALRGMLDRLDPHSSYFSPDDLARFNSQVEQEFGGVGIQVGLDPQGRLQVITPLPGSPAYKAGVRAGDLISQIEGESTLGYDVDKAARKLKGKPGAAVKLGVVHLGGTGVDELTVTREMIHVSSVLGDKYKPDGSWDFMLDPAKKIGYIRLVSFSRDSTKEVREALNSLKADGMKALVLDLRFNPGGLLSAATEIADMFVEDGVIVSTKGRNTEERVVMAQKANTFSGFPMAVLVNGYSASASEIVSACLQDRNRAVIVGDRSYGKGSVQNVIEMEQGKSALKLTTASYHRPSGKNIHRFPGAKESDDWGVTPNEGFRITLPIDELRAYDEYRRGRDVLSDKGPPASEFVDRQLQKALDEIHRRLDEADKAPAQKEGDKPAEEKKEEKKAAQIKSSAQSRAFVVLFEYEYILRTLKLRNSQPM